MPRPKRTKVASAVAAPIRVAKPPKSTTTTRPQREPPKPAQRLDSFSDDSDGLVVRSTRPRRRMPRQLGQHEDVEFVMAGALPANDSPGAEETNTGSVQTKTRSSRAVIPSSGRSTPASNASNSSRGRSSSARQLAKGPLGSRVADLADSNDAPSLDESSLMDPSLLTFGSLDSESPAHGTRPPSAMKVGGTPAHETSILALTNFKRRARQPSLLRMVRQTTDVEDNDLDDLDDFHPDAESTPLQLRKSGAPEIQNETSGISLSSSGSRGKKRKLSAPVVQVPCSSPPYEQPSGTVVDGSQRSSSPSLPAATIESDEEVVETQEPQDPELMSETMAPPRSSSPSGDETEHEPPTPANPRQRRRGRARKTERALASEGEESDRSAKIKTRAKHKKRAETISTAKLQSLLPRRRTQVAQWPDENDVQNSDDVEVIPDDSDQDELQLPPPRPALARKSATSKPNKKPSRAGKKPDLAASRVKRSTRTYGRQSSDKENDSAFAANDEDSVDVDESTGISVDLPKSKLAAIAKKFEEVDDFEMDFESVDVDGGTSSPWR